MSVIPYLFLRFEEAKCAHCSTGFTVNLTNPSEPISDYKLICNENDVDTVDIGKYETGWVWVLKVY